MMKLKIAFSINVKNCNSGIAKMRGINKKTHKIIEGIS
jgi:hypothetical protein